MPRPASGARERILETTLVLLREGGLSAAGLNEVIARSAAPKGSLYHYFPAGKSQLVAEALALYEPRIAALIEQSLHSGHPLSRRINALFMQTAKRMHAAQWRQSCAVGAVALDLTSGDEALRARCEAILRHWANVAEAGLPELPSAHAAPAARHLVALLEGAQIQARLRQSAEPLTEAAAAFRAYAHGLLLAEA
jgi:TetR/AcrR family transcriptional regulator, lmrAB and yxaGH operons repressor